MGRVSKGWLAICEGWIGCSGVNQSIRCSCRMNSQTHAPFRDESLTETTGIRDTPSAVAQVARSLREHVCRVIEWCSVVDAVISEDSSP